MFEEVTSFNQHVGELSILANVAMVATEVGLIVEAIRSTSYWVLENLSD